MKLQQVLKKVIKYDLKNSSFFMSIITEYTYDEYPLNGSTYYSGITEDAELTRDICLLVAEYISNSFLEEIQYTENYEIQCGLTLIGEKQRKIIIDYIHSSGIRYFCLVKLSQGEEIPIITDIHCWKVVDDTLAFQITSTGSTKPTFWWTISPKSFGLEGNHQDITDNGENLKLQGSNDYYFTKSN